MKIAHLNVRSLLNKFVDFKDMLISKDYHILAITETWLHNDVPNEAVAINGYKLIRKDRDGRGGGVGIYIKENLSFQIIETGDTIEQLCVSIKLKSVLCIIGVMYRPPTADLNYFLDNLENTVATCLSITDNIYLLGDTNVDLLKYDSPMAATFNNFMDILGLTQLVSAPTRITQSTSTLIDHIVTSKPLLVSDVDILNVDLTDHELIQCCISAETNHSPQFIYKYRDYSNFDDELFLSDLQISDLDAMFALVNIDDKIELLTNTITALIDQHAPIRTARISKLKAPWITSNLKCLMKLRDKAKTKFKKTKNQRDWNYYKTLRNFTNTAVKNEKKAYYSHKFTNSNSKTVWKELKYLNINNAPAIMIPSELNNVDDINFYYQNCIPRTAVNDTEVLNYYSTNQKCDFIEKFNFTLVECVTISKYLKEIVSTAIGDDKISVNMIRPCCPYIIKYLTHIINSCILENYFPDKWKNALVIPIPKISEPTDFKHLRPISILPVFSKLFEKIINAQLRQHIMLYDILPDIQSGFRPDYSCTTALLHVTNDILTSNDKGLATVLVLLDYTKAFDTLNHKVLLAVLHFIGLNANAINLIESFLSGRTQRVTYKDTTSAPLPITVGVPQGSILGPLLFTLYTNNFCHYLKYCSAHMYADDTQIYYSFPPSELDTALEKINSDLNTVADISAKHHLHLNPSKSVVMIFGTRAVLNRLDNPVDIYINNTKIPIVNSHRNLGLTMDNSFRYKTHIANCLKQAYLKLRLLYPHRSYLSQKIKTFLCETLVLSHFNYSSQVFSHCLDSDTLYKIQKVQNSCLRYIFGIGKFQHISHKLKQVQWLNMKNRFYLNTACMYNKIIKTHKPSYLFNKITFRANIHSVNIRNKNVITPPTHSTTQFERSFSFTISRIYNDIPPDVKSLPTLSQFKKKLKSTLLSQQFST